MGLRAPDLPLPLIAVGQLVTHYALGPAKLPQQHAREFLPPGAPVASAKQRHDAPRRRQATPKLNNRGFPCRVPPRGHLVPHAPTLTESTA